MDPRIRSIGKFAIKLSLSVAALYLVFQNIDIRQLWTLVTSANPWLLVLALFAYNASKVLSSFRLTRYFVASDIHLSEADNLRIYYIGMFYNLFLPGGIGGDAWKIWFLHRDEKVSVKKAFQSVLIDRLSGMVVLSALGLIFGWLSFKEIPIRTLLLVGAFATIPAMYAVHYFMSKRFIPFVTTTSLLSLGVQGIQVLCAWSLLHSIGISNDVSAYIAVFLLSSLVSVLPISIGGIGIRELVFIGAAGFAPISKDASVAFSLMFFVVTAVSAVPGAFLNTPRQ